VFARLSVRAACLSTTNRAAKEMAAKNNSKISNHGEKGASSGWQRLTFGSLKATTASALHLKHGKW